MAQQKFIDSGEAASQLGIKQDQLTQLREQGKLRGYRDGANWKFRVDEIEKILAEGFREAGQSVGSDQPLDVDLAGLTGDEHAASSIKLDGLEDLSGAAKSEFDEIDLGSLDNESVEEDDDDPESVLLSETEFGDSENRPPSTIIGKVDLDPGSEMDLFLESDEDQAGQSDVRLASSSDVLSSDSASERTGSGNAKSKFEPIEELEIDLEAESSRILSPEHVAQARQAAEAEAAGGPSSQVTDSSGLEIPGLEESDRLSGMSSLNVHDDSGKGSDPRLSGLSQLRGSEDSGAGGAGLTGLSNLELEPDVEDVLSEASDITLSSQDSGINLVSPSDSGLALDDEPIELGGSAIGSGLDLGDDSLGLASADGGSGGDADGVFSLTADTTDSNSGEEDSSSQIIALDEVVDSEEMAAGAAIFDDVGLEDAAVDHGMDLVDEGHTVIPSTEVSFSLGSVLGLTGCIVLLCLGGIMMFDLVRNIWSWNKTYSLNSSLIDSILSLFPS